jgi:eukaryotic-like serine/threonine-protein kinase
VDEALRVAEEMAQGLSHAHSRGVLHRDLKPANVFLTGDGRVKLLDFGLAHLLGTPGSSGAGTPAYMSPEQARGDAVDERADVHAAGMVLGEMLTGKRPVAPSPASPLDLPGVPRPVAKAVATALSTDPAARPRDGAAWLAALRAARERLARPRRARRIAVLASVGLVLGIAVAGLATWRVWERQIPGGRPIVAVADFANETGEKELDSLSGLLITSLEQSTQLRVLTRGRMFDVLRQLGKPEAHRIDEVLAREVGRETRARALLLASIRKLGDSYVVEMRALDPLHDEYLFTVSDRASGKAAVFDLVDRLGEATRKRLRTGGESTPQRQVATITTRNVKAWEQLFLGRQAFDQGRLGEAKQRVAAALQEDPEFPLAHYQLAILDYWEGESLSDEGFRHLEAAERLSDRLPEKERLLVHAMRTRNWDEKLRLVDEAAEGSPLDKEAQFYAGDVRFHAGDPRSAIPYFERAVQLDPQYRIAVRHLSRAFSNAGQDAEHLAWLRIRRERAGEAWELSAIGQGLLEAGQEDEAVEVLRRAAVAAGQPWRPAVVMARYLSHRGRGAEVEGALRERLSALEAAPGGARPGEVITLRTLLGVSLLAQGRLAEWRALEGEVTDWESQGPYLRQWSAVVGRDPVALRSATAELGEISPSAAHVWALNAAEGGEAPLAGSLAGRVLAGEHATSLSPTLRRLMVAVAAWGGGATDQAVRTLEEVAGQPDLPSRYTALLLLGEVQRGSGNCPGAIAALERARGFRWSFSLDEWYGTHPGVLHALALCYERTGDLARARERNQEMLRLWARADPDLPLLVEAKALQSRLASAATAAK